jgi:hypothetical protein
MKTSNLRAARVVAVSSMVAIWACAAGDDPPPAGAGDDAGPGTTLQEAAAPADASLDAPVYCDSGSDCDAYPNECGPNTLCAASVSVDPSARLLGLWAANDHDIWAAGTMGLVIHYDGSAWKTIPTGLQQTFRSVAGTGPNDVWFSSTERFLLHSQGIAPDGTVRWDVYDSSSSGTPHLMQAIWGNAEQGMWGLIDNTYGPAGLILHSDGWQPGVGPQWNLDLAPTYMDPPGPYGGRSLFGFGATDAWSGWVGGQLYRRVSGKWKELNSTTRETLNDMWGASADDLWFVGTNGSIRHWDGKLMTTLETEPSLRQRSLLGVRGSGPNDLWIVGEDALVLHYDGQHLTRIPVGGLRGKRPELRRVWVSDSSDQIWIVGDGVVLGGKKGAFQ